MRLLFAGENPFYWTQEIVQHESRLFPTRLLDGPRKIDRDPYLRDNSLTRYFGSGEVAQSGLRKTV